MTPMLCVIIDTEEEFDWHGPFDPANRAVSNIAAQAQAKEIFARYGIVPTYVIDHPVASDADAVAVLKAFQDAGEAVIGAHLHPWVNPPHEETVSRAHSYPGNLPKPLERRKLEVLTAAIAEAFGRRPTVYKAGRYGLGPHTPAILAALGYEIDLSIVPYTSFAADCGPDFRSEGPQVRTLQGTVDVMELPLTVGFAGRLRALGPRWFRSVSGAAAVRLHLPGVLARLGLLERIRLSPEGAHAEDHIRLVRAMAGAGQKVFSYTYHSPSLTIGHTPYVRSQADLDRFLSDMDRFFDFFFSEMGGVARTPQQIRQAWLAGDLQRQAA
ncbi:MAG: polysaccharide deacetylase family protein [Rhodothalassiaceae bacterium]